MIELQNFDRRPENNRPVIHRQEMAELSLAAYLPRHEPEVYIHSLEHTNGERTGVKVRDIVIGAPRLILAAGPCSVDTQNDGRNFQESVAAAKAAGADILRGGAFKPRTSPYSFQGLGMKGLEMLKTEAKANNMAVVTESKSIHDLQAVAQNADIIQIGARNSQNFDHLIAVGLVAQTHNRAVLLKRGAFMSIDETLFAAEYILATGCEDVILCERGSYLPDGSYGFDSDGVRELRSRTHLPIIGDPTHAAESVDEVPGIAKAAVAAGADGLIIETYPRPDEAESDGKRALLPQDLRKLMEEISSNPPSGRYFQLPE